MRIKTAFAWTVFTWTVFTWRVFTWKAFKWKGLTLILLVSACSAQPNATPKNLNADTMAYSYHAAPSITAVFQSGLGDDRSTWVKVIKQLPATQATFIYDRYGYGKSAAASSTRDPCTIAREQHELLVQAGVKPPYLLVGHSIGGLYEYVFALMYPQDVAGLILLDPTHPQHWETVQREAPTAATILKTMRATVFPSIMRKEFDAQAECLSGLPQTLSDSVRINTRILTSTLLKVGEQGDYQDVLKKLRIDWLRLTGITKTEPVEKATHYIQTDRPDVVVNAILDFNVRH